MRDEGGNIWNVCKLAPVREPSKDIRWRKENTHTSHMTNPGGKMATAAVVYQICVPVFHQPGLSGKTVPELEKTVGLLKKVVERVQRENETLKKSGASAAGQQETLRLKVGLRFPPPPASTVARLFIPRFLLFPKNEIENLRSRSEAELNSRLASKTKEFEKVIMENERLRKALKRVSDL